ncbi:MAG: ABC transporter ATP-binding protein [Candidatus Adiutrix sp.]|nr:ABC transporter ATP-binding protein [Candidatus Adiutrix sp.]
MIEVRDLYFAYAPKEPPVLRGLSLRIETGEVVNILGPNGCGKTTLLRAMLGFLPTPPGTVFIGGAEIHTLKRRDLARRLAYVPQIHGGVFNYSVLEVVLMGRTALSPWLGFSPVDQDRALAALNKVRIARLAGRPYLQLSGGERQLVLIARALAQNGRFLIMDEPVSGLDYGNQFHLLTVIRELAEQGLSIVLTTHHPEQAVFLGGRSLLLKDGQLRADGPSREVITAPAVCALYDLSPEMLAQARRATF